jgi:hypothetical protein
MQYLQHRRIGAAPHALDLPEGEHAVGGGLALVDAQVRLDDPLDLLRAADHARGRAAQLQRG